MIKVVEFFNRRADLAPEAFLAHWQDRHTDVVLAINGLRRYVQNPVIGLAGLPTAPFDGVVEVWFDDIQSMRDNGRSDYWPVVVADEQRFIDRDSRQLLLVDGAGSGPLEAAPKLMLLLGKRPDTSVDQFQQQLTALVGGMSAVPGLREVVCDLPIPSSYDKPRALAGDALLSLRFATWHDAEAAIAAGVAVDLKVHTARLVCLAVAERVIKR